MSIPVIALDAVCLDWPDGTVALENVSGTLSGITGLVGRNGTGKSTLLRLISGELTPTSGSVRVGGAVAVLPQHQSLRTGTIADALGISAARSALAAIEAGDGDPAHFDAVGDRWNIAELAVAALTKLGVPTDLDRPVRTLSGGQAVLVGLAGVQLSAAPIALLDEPTNNLDRRARAVLIEAVRAWRGTLIVASHDRELLDNVDSIAELYGHKLRSFTGNFAVYADAIAAEQAAALRRASDAEALVRREKLDRIAAAEYRARSQAAGRRAQLAGGIPKIVAGALKEKSQLTSARSKALHEGREADAQAQLREAEAAVRDDRSIVVRLPETHVPAGRTVLALGTIAVRGPERIALSGANGSGKSTLLEAIMQFPDVPAGPQSVLPVTMRIPSVGIVRQRIVLDTHITLVDALREVHPEGTQQQARAMLANFLFRGNDGDKLVGELSGGERFRLALARVLIRNPQLLLLDEPTNDLDLDSVRQLTEALAAFEGALIVVSHDERFLRDLSLTRRWTIEDGLVDAPFAMAE